MVATIEIRGGRSARARGWLRYGVHARAPLVLLRVDYHASIVIGLLHWQVLSTCVQSVPDPATAPRPPDGVPMVESGEIFPRRHQHGRVSRSDSSRDRSRDGARRSSRAHPLLHELLDPIIELLRYLSPTAMIPIAVIWFGIGETSKYFLIFWGTFFIVLVNTTAGVMARADHPPARRRMPGCQSAADLSPGRRAVRRPLHRHRDAGRDGVVLHEHHPGRDPGRRFRHRLPAAELVGAVQTNRIFVALVSICLLGFVFDRIFRMIVDQVLARYMSAGLCGPHQRRDIEQILHQPRCGGDRRAVFRPAGAPEAQEDRLFGQPSVNNDSIWMAFARAISRTKGLDVEYRSFPRALPPFRPSRPDRATSS